MKIRKKINDIENNIGNDDDIINGVNKEEQKACVKSIMYYFCLERSSYETCVQIHIPPDPRTCDDVELSNTVQELFDGYAENKNIKKIMVTS